jgi:3-oxoadipate enol-lactonase
VRRVRAGDVWLAYRTWGPAQAPPLVLLHALGEASSDWATVAAALAPAWRVYAPDLRGHGESDWPGSYTIDQLTADLAAFIDALGLDRVTLVGHSIGGPPAYLYAARYPGRVARLVLEEPAPPWPRERRVLVRPDEPLPFDWDVTALSNEFNDPQVSSWRDSLRQIQAPALIVAGGPDSHIDQSQLADMATLIPDCELVTIPAGHVVHSARPAEFIRVVTSFLRLTRHADCHEARARRNIRLCRRVPSLRMRWSGWMPRSVAPSLRIAAADRPFRSSVRSWIHSAP